MKKVLSYVLVMLMIVFFIFRLVVTMQTQLGGEFLGVKSINTNLDIALLFISIICIILIIKRNLIGALVYLLGYGMYLGSDIVKKVQILMNSSEILESGDIMTVFTGIVSIVIAVAILIDVLLDQKQKINPVDKETDWFFKNEKFDRKYDERADRNHYKNM